MTGIVEQPTSSTLDKDTRIRHQNRTLKIILLVVAIIAVALGGVLIYNATDTDNDASSSTVPDDVQQVIDDFATAMENNDYAAMQELVTTDFRRPDYVVEADGTGEYRQVYDVGDFDFLETAAGIEYAVTATGTPVVRGDGPWIVAVPQDWLQVGTGTGYEAVYTFAIVDKDGTLQIEDAYWAGIGPVPMDE